jgi:hypothetical protein
VETKSIVPEAGGPLTQHHYDELAKANDRAKPIRRASRVAAFNGWTIALIALLSAPFAVFGLDGLLVTVGLFVVAYLEFRGRHQMLKFNPSAASLLGWNQVGFMMLILAYCCWMIFAGATEIQAIPGLSQLLGADGLELYRTMVVAFYGTVIALTMVFQGGNAIYYFTRRKYIVAYLQQTPQWVRDFQRVSGAT